MDVVQHLMWPCRDSRVINLVIYPFVFFEQLWVCTTESQRPRFTVVLQTRAYRSTHHTPYQLNVIHRIQASQHTQKTFYIK